MILCKHYGIPQRMYTLNVPPYSKYWPEDGLVKLKHVAKTVYYWLRIDVVLRLIKQLFRISWLAENRLASQEELCSMEWVSKWRGWGFRRPGRALTEPPPHFKVKHEP